MRVSVGLNSGTKASFHESDERLYLHERFRNGIKLLLQDIRQAMPTGPFDLICCRHLVFTYFDEQLQRVLFDQLLERLGNCGFLVIGKQEKLPIGTSDLRHVEPHSGVYRLREEALPT